MLLGEPVGESIRVFVDSETPDGTVFCHVVRCKSSNDFVLRRISSPALTHLCQLRFSNTSRELTIDAEDTVQLWSLSSRYPCIGSGHPYVLLSYDTEDEAG